jgi:outer membrane protein
MKPKYALLALLTALTASSVPALAHEAGQWIVRAGIGVVDPKGDNLTVTEPPDTITVNVDNGTSMTLMGTYMFTENWALDILASWPFKHDISVTTSGTVNGTIPFAEAKHLPPTVSIQYHFLPGGGFQPYVGAGINYTIFTSVDLTPEAATAFSSVDLDNSWGLAAQLGADMMLNDHWLVNVDLRWIDIDADAIVDGQNIGTVAIDPLVYSLNVGYRF